MHTDSEEDLRRERARYANPVVLPEIVVEVDGVETTYPPRTVFVIHAGSSEESYQEVNKEMN